MFNANNNYTQPQAGVSVNLGDVTVGLEVARNYKRIALADEPSKWESIRRKVISVYDIVHARKADYGNNANLAPNKNWDYYYGTDPLYDSTGAVIEMPGGNIDRLKAAGAVFPAPEAAGIFATPDVWGDAVVVVHCWGEAASVAGKKRNEIFEARKRGLLPADSISVPAGKDAFLHSVSVSFYDYNEALPVVCQPMYDKLCKDQVYTEMGGEPVMDCMIYGYVPNAFVDEMGIAYKDTGLADGFVVGIIKGTKIQAAGTPLRGDALKLFAITQGKYRPTTDYGNAVLTDGTIPDFTTFANLATYVVSNDFTTAHYPWHLTDGKFGTFTDKLAMHTQGLLMQSAPVSSVKHGALPSDVLPNYYRIKLSALNSSNAVISEIAEFTTSVPFDAPASDTLWLQSINEMDIKLPIGTAKVTAEVQGLGWFTNLPFAEITADDKAGTKAQTTLLLPPFSPTKHITVPVEMPIKIQLDVRYA